MVNSTLTQAALDEIERRDRITKARNAYDGKYPDIFKVTKPGSDDNVKPNLARFIVDKTAEFLFGAGVTLKAEDSDEANEYLEQAFKRNKWPTFLEKLAASGSVTGHPFVKIVPPRPERGEKVCRWIVLDPSEVTVTWDSDDIEEVLRYKIEWNATDITGKPIVRKQVIERTESGMSWTVSEYEASRSQYGTVVTFGEWKLLKSVDWPFTWPPIVDCQNLPLANVYYGLSDLEPDILHIIQRIHFTLSNTSRINRIHAHPKTVGAGITKTQLNMDVDDVLLIPAGATLNSLTASGDIAGSLELYKALKDVLSEITKIPPITAGKTESIGAFSGIALKILYGPLVELTRRKRSTYGDLLTEMARRSLELANMPDIEVDIEWVDPVPTNDLELRQALQIDLDLGIVSQETVAAKLGYDWEAEKKKIKAEEAAGLRSPVQDPALQQQPPYDPSTDNVEQ